MDFLNTGSSNRDVCFRKMPTMFLKTSRKSIVNVKDEILHLQAKVVFLLSRHSDNDSELDANTSFLKDPSGPGKHP